MTNLPHTPEEDEAFAELEAKNYMSLTHTKDEIRQAALAELDSWHGQTHRQVVYVALRDMLNALYISFLPEKSDERANQSNS